MTSRVQRSGLIVNHRFIVIVGTVVSEAAFDWARCNGTAQDCTGSKANVQRVAA